MNDYLIEFVKVKGHSDDGDWWYKREECRIKYGFPIPSEAQLECIAQYAPIVEVGAGVGYWASLLQGMGIDIVPTDMNDPEHSGYKFRGQWTTIERLSAKQAIAAYPHRTLMSLWPCYHDGWLAEALKEYAGKYFIYQGEDKGGCTGTDELFEQLEKDWNEIAVVGSPQWFGLHDNLYIFERK